MATLADDVPFQEWTECRTSIGRFDTILEDLRKFGFSLVTTLLTASAFLGFAAPTAQTRVLTSIAIMVLVTVLFGVDTFYQVLLLGAVERAIELERQMKPEMLISKRLHDYATNTWAFELILGLYVGLLVTTALLGLVESLSAPRNVNGGVAAIVAVALVLLGFVFLYSRFVARKLPSLLPSRRGTRS